MDTKPAFQVAAGCFVAAEIDGTRTLCLKAERIGKEHVNHFLLPLDPLPDRRRLALVYIDPELPLVPVEGVGLAFDDGPADTAPDVGDAFLTPMGIMVKVLDGPKSQRLHAYVDLTLGQVRARMERHVQSLVPWRVQRL